MAKVSVITRTKDRPLLLRRALKSVTAQKFDDYVHVIINDGGNVDDVEAAINELPDGAREKIKVFHRPKSSNAPDTIFNESVERVVSEYFAFHDDDDTWHPDHLKLSIAHLEENKHLGAVVVRADKIIEEIRGKTIKQIKVQPWMPDLKVINLYRQCIENQLTAGLTVYRYNAYKDVGKFDDSLPVVGDWEFGIRLLMKYDVDFIDPGYALAYYHHRKPGHSSSEAASTFETNSHRYYVNQVMNRYLREELVQGKLGVGYIMNKTRYNQAFIFKLAQRFTPGFVANRLKKRLQG